VRGFLRKKKKGESDMSEQIITFDNLVRATDVIGEYKVIEAKASEPFVSPNAPGLPVSVGSLKDVSRLATGSAERFAQAFSV